MKRASASEDRRERWFSYHFGNDACVLNSYDELGQLTKVTEPDTTEWNWGGVQLVTEGQKCFLSQVAPLPRFPLRVVLFKWTPTL